MHVLSVAGQFFWDRMKSEKMNHAEKTLECQLICVNGALRRFINLTFTRKEE